MRTLKITVDITRLQLEQLGAVIDNAEDVAREDEMEGARKVLENLWNAFEPNTETEDARG